MESSSIESLQQEIPQQSPAKSRLRSYAVAASIALGGFLGYGIGYYYTNESRSSKQSVVQTHQQVTQPAPETKKITAGSITELADRYVLESVIYRGKPHKVAWSKTYLNNGAFYTQDGHIKKMKIGDYGEWTIPDAPLYHASVFAVSGQKGELADKVKKMFREDFDEWVMTSSRVLYRPEGLDKIIHRFGHVDEYAQDVALVGPDMFITPTSNCAGAVSALLGTNNIAEVERVYTELTGMKPYLWRVDQKTKLNTERAVVLGVNFIGDRFNLDADEVIVYQRLARGVVVK